MADAPIAVERGVVCRITLNRPERLNALGDSVRRALADVMAELADDLETRVVLLRGAGRAFSAGADLSGMEPAAAADAAASRWVSRRHRSGGWQRLLDAIEGLPQVTVASTHGYVVGGAALLAVSCDIRIASDDVQVWIPEQAIGIPLTWAGLPRLTREIGLPLTRDLVMTGRRMGAEEALRCGFVQRVAPAADLDRATDELVASLVEQPAGPLAMTKAALHAIGRAHPGTAAAWSDPDVLAWSLAEPESREAAIRYQQKRTARRPDHG